VAVVDVVATAAIVKVDLEAVVVVVVETAVTAVTVVNIVNIVVNTVANTVVVVNIAAETVVNTVVNTVEDVLVADQEEIEAAETLPMFWTRVLFPAWEPKGSHYKILSVRCTI